jgi:hypothetical protein
VALAHDTSTRFPVSGTATVLDTTTGDRTISHAGSASAKGVVVVLAIASSSADGVTGITYGGVALSQRQVASDTTEANRVTVWTLPDDTACPTGTQDVVFQGCVATGKVGWVHTVTAATTGTKYNAGNKVDTTVSTNPTVNVVTTATTLLYGAVGGGAAAPTSYVVGTNYSAMSVVGADFGALSAQGQRRTSPVASGTIQFNFSFGTSDDWCIAAVALEEYTLPVSVEAIQLLMAPRIPIGRRL